MKSTNKNIRYVSLDAKNIDLAFDIQKTIWEDDPDYNCFVNKLHSNNQYDTCFIVYLNEKPIGITGTYTEDIDDESIWLDWYGILPQYRGNKLGETILIDTISYCKNYNKFKYFRLDTTYYEGRIAINLYDKIMDLREEYTVEDTETINHNWLIYTYILDNTNDIKPWNNKYLGLDKYYKNCK